jgi:hypothetical protein
VIFASNNNTGGKFATGSPGEFAWVSTTPAANFHPVPLLLLISLVLTTPMANNGNNIRLLTPLSELEGKNVSLC